MIIDPPLVAVVGGGPAGLMAAEILVAGGVRVEVFDAMPSVGRKFLMAGRGGMNITHSEPRETFLSRYGSRQPWLQPLIDIFGPEALRRWLHELGIQTFVGTSGRVFPRDMKAAPLLRAWLQRLRVAGVVFHVRHRWCGWEGEGRHLRFETPAGERLVAADAVVLALGGGSWPQLGSDGAWVPRLQERGVGVARLRPANCGFDVGWSEHFQGRFAGQPVKPVVACLDETCQQGEFNITATGVEGGLVYALSASLRDAIEARGTAILHLDLAPGRSLERLTEELSRPRGRDSLSNHLRRRAGIEGVKAGLLREMAPPDAIATPLGLAAAIKALPLRLRASRPLVEAISTAGGVVFEALGADLMLREAPGVFCAGEMLDWEAPTGGYLLTACFATGRAAGAGALAWVDRLRRPGIDSGAPRL